jgi:hypothetical protein
MNRALIRFTTAIAACCGLVAGSMALPAEARTRLPARAATAIVVPRPDQMTRTADTLDCPWLNGYLLGLSAGITGVGALSGSAMAATRPRSLALLAVAPLAAVECAMTGH